jgi:hypothetical protein
MILNISNIWLKKKPKNLLEALLEINYILGTSMQKNKNYKKENKLEDKKANKDCMHKNFKKKLSQKSINLMIRYFPSRRNNYRMIK